MIRAKTILLAFTMVSVLAAPLAEAARLGGGRSAGMRRVAPTQTYTPAPAAPAAPAPAPAQAAPRRGPGIGTAVAAGAAGAAVGYMIGSSHGNQANAAPAPANASQPVAAPVQEPERSIPWGLIAGLVALLAVGLMWFRRRAGTPEDPRTQPLQSPAAGQNRFEPIPKIGSGFPAAGGFATAEAPVSRLPDGTETPYFLRQAKATFLHLQSLNTPDSVEEVRRYMTPELFDELRGTIAGNGDVADFQNLDCRLIDSAAEAGRYIASVRFSGQVSESVNASPVPFNETWHYVKDPAGTKWLVAGIQQD
ncbi:Tim44 domain-containing protein [Paludibacterium yongneupense]|uniref:Tim44 domain-containing protein n=1 Tax=Paludibacterium yongneupense TaxID=400061 RepID=UPI0003F80CD1|nr:Tim44-like domain-containing protein [Paludibacterium yongneupense]